MCVPVAVKLRRELLEGTSGIKYSSSKVGVVRLLLLSGLRVNPNTGGFRSGRSDRTIVLAERCCLRAKTVERLLRQGMSGWGSKGEGTECRTPSKQEGFVVQHAGQLRCLTPLDGR